MRYRMILRRWWVQMTADRRQFSALCTLLVLGLLLWTRIIVISRMPRTVVADDPALMAENAAGDVDGGVGTSGAPITIALAIEPGRDPFRIDSGHFPVPVVESPTEQEQPKSAAAPSEEPSSLVRQLRLEAVMRRNPMAVISGRTYRVGDEIVLGEEASYNFRLVEVRERAVVLEHDGKRYELTMSIPGGH